MDVAAPLAFSPARLGGLELKNRILKAATFEGMSPGGVPSEALKRFHCDIARGGVAMTTIAYCTTEADGRLSEDMMYLHEGIQAQLRDLTDAIRAAGARVSGQLVHCGGFSKNRKLQRLRRPLGPSRGLNMLGIPAGLPIAGAMRTEDIDYLVGTYGTAARLMKRVGFDAIEIHFGHGYALSQFISPKTNRRSDEYGGSLDNRMRLPLRVLDEVREAVGDGFPILGKMSMSDGVRGGVRWEEGVRVAELLDLGGIDALVTSAGTSSFNPMLMFRGKSILNGMIEVEKNAIARLGLRLVGPRMFRDYPYEELYLLDRAKKIRDRVECSVVYIGGCSSRESLERAIEAQDLISSSSVAPSFTILISCETRWLTPDYVNGCTHCNRCVALIDDPAGIRCPAPR